MTTEIAIKEELGRWVAKQSTVFDGEVVPSDVPIIERRIITSVQLMDLILYLEHLLGAPINPQHIAPGAFTSVDSIYRHFFNKESTNA